MIVKERDASSERMAWLERLELMESNPDQRRMIHNARSRLRSTSPSEHACGVINTMFSTSSEWMVLHDLRLSENRRVIHANHVLVNDALEFFILDSRYLRYGLSVNETGNWQVHTTDEQGVIASPMNKLDRDVRYLKNYLKECDLLPGVFGIKRPVSVQGFVLVNPSIRSSKAVNCDVDASAIVSSDNLFRLIWKETGHWLNKRIKPVKFETLRQLAHKLSLEHKSTMPMRFSSGYGTVLQRAVNPAAQPEHTQKHIIAPNEELLKAVSANTPINS